MKKDSKKFNNIQIISSLMLLSAWSLLSAGERNAYYQKTQALLPLSLLATLRSNLYAAGSSSLQGIRELPALTLNAFSQFASKDGNSHHLHIHNIQGNMQKALTAEEYENILNHVNEYVQRLVDIKLQDQREQEAQLHRTQPISEAQMQVIVKVIQENLSRFAREREDTLKFKFSDLSEADLQRLVSLVRLQLEQSNWATNLPVRLTSENIEEIKKLIQQNIEVNNHAHYTLLVERIDLDALLKRILVAPELARFVDGRINIAIDEQRLKFTAQQESSGTEPATATALDEQHRLINALNSEIAFIKLALADKVSENADLQQSISSLKFSQDDLLKRIQEHELSTDKRFSALLAEIERKLATLNETQFTLFNKQIKLSLVEILGFKQDGKFEDIDLQNWVRNIFVAKDYLEQRLVELSSRMNDRFKDETDRLGVLLMRNISEQLKHEILLTVETRHKESMANLKGHITSSFDEDEVRRIVKSVLAVYDADKTGLADFALESAGGTVLSTRCTESYQTKTAQVSIFGIPLWYPSNTPRTAISPNVQPGNCWAFQGFPGFLVLKLNSLIYVTGFTMEHIPRSLSPTGTIASAPRNFTVWALEHEKDFDPIQYGEYEYLDNGASLQYFPVQNQDIKRPYQFVELRIETNHGHPTYTCLYRFRVHGKPAET